jgi:predicted nicotinamide N-methyase
MAALPPLSSERLCPTEYDPRGPKMLASLDTKHQQQEVKLRDEQSVELTTCSWFDPDTLASLDSRMPSTLELWRLRLRFGLPTRVAPGELFRVAIDLVDEMGQPPPPSELGRLGRSIHPPLIQLLQDEDGDLAGRVALRLMQVPSKALTKWVFEASIEFDEAMATAAAVVACRLLIALNPVSDVFIAKSAFHQDFQGFCAHSVWLADNALVLPLQSDRIQVGLTPERLSCQHPATTTCRRLFSVPSPPGADASEQSRQMIAITENYGDAMGAHIWDASILLSFALVDAAPHLNTLREPTAMAELGAGCGLFACVFRALFATAASAIVLTERAESARLLQSNVEQNEDACVCGGPLIQVVPLVWGHFPLPPALATRAASTSSRGHGIGVVFAADVLYYWDTHVALLSTLAALSTRDAEFQVIIAHKHRGAATTRALEGVLARCGRHEGGNGATTDQDGHEADAWNNWYVDRLARLGKVDLLRLTRRR